MTPFYLPFSKTLLGRRVELPALRVFVVPFAVSAAVLAGAHAFETFGGYLPCPLCLKQREVHWTALAVAAAAGLVLWRWRLPWVRVASLLAVLAVYGWSLWVSGFHSGVEYKWWPGPSTCGSGAAILSGEVDLLASLQNKTMAVPCDEAAWRMAGISMAGYNFLISLAVVVFLTVLLYGDGRRLAAEGLISLAPRACPVRRRLKDMVSRSGPPKGQM